MSSQLRLRTLPGLKSGIHTCWPNCLNKSLLAKSPHCSTQITILLRCWPFHVWLRCDTYYSTSESACLWEGRESNLQEHWSMKWKHGRKWHGKPLGKGKRHAILDLSSAPTCLSKNSFPGVRSCDWTLQVSGRCSEKACWFWNANGLLTSRSLAWGTNSSILWSMTASTHICKNPCIQNLWRLSLLPCVQKALAGLTFTTGNHQTVYVITKNFSTPTIYTVKADIVMILWVFLGLAPSTWTLADTSYSSGEIVPVPPIPVLPTILAEIPHNLRCMKPSDLLKWKLYISTRAGFKPSTDRRASL